MKSSAVPPDPTDLDWMELHLRCLYHHDANDRIQTKRQPGGGASPLFHLGRTRLGNLWRLRSDLEPAVVRDLARLAGREPPLGSPDPTPTSIPAQAEPPAPPERAEALRRVLVAAIGEVATWRGPAFRFPSDFDGPEGPLPVVEVTPDRAELLAGGLEDWIPELAVRQPCLAAVDNGRAVSLCCPSRPLEVPGSPTCAAAEAGVETLAPHRGQGLAPAVVAAWARAVRELGAEPIYSTSWDNRASRAVARSLGLVFYGEDLHFSLV